MENLRIALENFQKQQDIRHADLLDGQHRIELTLVSLSTTLEKMAKIEKDISAISTKVAAHDEAIITNQHAVEVRLLLLEERFGVAAKSVEANTEKVKQIWQKPGVIAIAIISFIAIQVGATVISKLIGG